MADSKITGLTADTAPDAADLVVVVDDIAGTPTNKKVTIGNLTKGLTPSAATAKTAPVAADIALISDSAASNVAKGVTLANLTKGLSPNALTAKSAPVPADEAMIGDTEASNVAKKATLAELNPAINAQVTTVAQTANFTFALTDRGKVTTISNAGATTGTIPPNSSVAFPTGTILTLIQIGAGACTWTEGAGVTINTNTSKYSVNANGEPTTNGQYAMSLARKTATDTWEVYGDLIPLNPTLDQPFAISDETTALTTGAAKLSWYSPPYAITLLSIAASVVTAPTGASLIIDVNAGGTSIMTTNKLTIEVSEFHTKDATTQPTLTTTAIAANTLMTADIDQVGSTVAGAGAKVIWTYRKT